MQIHCEFCGYVIETDTEDCCQNCGATYENNKEYLKLKLLKLEEEKHQREKEKAALKRKEAAERRKEEKRKQEQRKKNFATGILIFFIIIMFVIPGLVGVCLGIYESIHPEISMEEIENEHYINATAAFTEFADNTTYAVKVDRVEEINKTDYYIPEGYMCIAVHIIIKNTSDEDIQVWTPSVNCIVDGFVQDFTYDVRYKDITTNFVAPGLSTDGYAIFRIPENMNTIQLQYDQYITIDIGPENIQRLNKNE